METLKPTFESRPSFTVIGIKWRGLNGPAEIPDLWHRFIPLMEQISTPDSGREEYGVERNCDPCTQEFDYLACVEVTQNATVPEGMEKWEIPAADYAVFQTQLQNIASTYQQVMREWLPTSGYQISSDYSLEYYGSKFDGENLTLHFPVTKGV